jgi:capsular exopolysaccharide synthesis family protein
MSRIHEALKKAAQERNAQRLDTSNAGPVDLTSEGLAGAFLTDTDDRTRPEGLPAVAGGEDVAFPQFQKFVKNCAHPAWKMRLDGSVFCSDSLFPYGAERFRTLRSRLYQIASAQPLRSLLVTSSVAAEGKTFVASNLAQSIVRQPNRCALLIDADLRAPRLHVPFGAPTTPGLSDYLQGKADESQIIQVGPEGNLCLIPAGSLVSNPSELLHSERMRLFIDRMSHIFDWVILDSPPVLAVHDASILADMCDGILFVVRAGATDSTLAERAVVEFREKNLLGVVLNRVDKTDSYGGYYYGYEAGTVAADAKHS